MALKLMGCELIPSLKVKTCILALVSHANSKEGYLGGPLEYINRKLNQPPDKKF